MHTHSRLWLAAATAATIALVPAPARAQGAFEGVVTFQMGAGRQGPQTMQYSIKGTQVRTDVASGGMGMYMLYNGDTKTMSIVMPESQMYMERSAASMPASADSAAAHTKITWTGQKETIAGYECEHATVVDDKGQTVDVCLAKGLGSFMQMGGGMGGRGRSADAGWAGHLGQMFPLKVTQDGKVQLEATSIQKKTLDASLFTIPAGYHKMSMGGPGGVQ